MTIELKDLVKIDKRFENSVNLYLDLDNREKIDNYVYTRSSQRIIDYYIDNVNKDREHATMLIGPYGKGKSHTLLVLLDKLRHRERPYLPIIISGTNSDLNQAFLVGITDALKRAGLDSITPDSYYSEAVRKIEQWKDSFPDAYSHFAGELQKNGCNEKTLQLGLEKNQKEALDLFRRIYPIVTNGSEFNPIIVLETVRIYEQIKDTLARDYGYAGIYVIFDEFSKYIEGHEADTFSKDMKVLQDMCELSERSSEGQMFITFVAHKSIKEYGAKLPVDMRNAFRGVEGRIKEVLFVVSSQNNYELIGNVLKKDEAALRELPKIGRYYENALNSYRFSCFSGLFDEADFKKYVVEGCFPLMPFTAYMLLHISEKVAQNERSIFTYLSHDEKGSVCRIIEDYGEDIADCGITADTVYDYFKNLFREEASDTVIHNEWLKAEYALSRTVDKLEKKLIKVIALINIIDIPDELTADVPQLSCALNISEDECRTVVERLVEKRIIIYRSRRHSYSFYNNVGVDIQKEISLKAAKLPADSDILGTLKEISEYDYVLPKKYNQVYSMTRYYEYVFMSPEQIEKLPSPEILFEQHFSDGKIVAVVSDNSTDYSKELSERLKDDRIVVLVTKVAFDKGGSIRKYIAAKSLMSDRSFIEDNIVLEQELVNYCDDISYEVNKFLKEAYNPESGACAVYHNGEAFRSGFRNGFSFNMFLSSIMTEYYNNAPVVNNELINRQNISAQNKKARNKIVDMLLSSEDCSSFEKGTSPEATIYRAVLVNTGILGNGGEDRGCAYVLSEIERFIAMCDSNKCSFKLLYDRLMGSGYGVRKGIIPIYVALCLSRLQDKPIVSFKEKEVNIDAVILGNINDSPSDYYLYVEHESIEKQNYIAGLMKLFGVSARAAGVAGDREVLDGILRWYRALPQVAANIGRVVDVSENMAAALKRLCMALRHQEYNPHEFLFKELVDIAGRIGDSEKYSADGAVVKSSLTESPVTNTSPEAGSLAGVLHNITLLKAYLDSYLLKLSGNVAAIVKKRCKADDGDSLKSVLEEHYSEHGKRLEKLVTKSRTSAILSYISDIPTYDEGEIVSKLSKLVTDIYIDDWRDGMLEKFRAGWDEFCDEAENTVNSESALNSIILKGEGGSLLERSYADVEDDSTGYFLKNAIKDALDEFGDSLETNAKVAVLAQVLAELVAGESR